MQNSLQEDLIFEANLQRLIYFDSVDRDAIFKEPASL